MSVHAILWLVLFLLFGALTMRRSSWGIPMYLMTFYASPVLWWWGGPLAAMGERWSLIAALVFLVAVLIDSRPKPIGSTKYRSYGMRLILLYAVNATFVHIVFASADPEESWKWLDLLWKQTGLLYLMLKSIKDKRDFQIMCYTLLLGGTFLACEYYFFGAGSQHQGRLEGLPLPSGGSSNFVSPILTQSIIIGGCIVLFGTMRERIVGLFCCALLTETILQSLSRGGLLAIIVGAFWLVLTSKGRIRLIGIGAIIAASLGGLAIMGEEQRAKVFGRFSSTFAEAEERDISAESRLVLWRATYDMVLDRPLGSGGNAFKSDLGQSYVPGEWRGRFRASQNGFLDTAASWGVQGLALLLGALGLAWFNLRRCVRFNLQENNAATAFLGSCLDATLIVLLVSCIFISGLRGEWFFWWLAMALSFEAVFVPLPQNAEQDIDSDDGIISTHHDIQVATKITE